MAKLILKFEAAVLKEIPLQKATLTFGRAPGNDVVIDNLAVSGHHARLVLDQDHYVIEDMSSLNGTFLNNQRIRRSALKDGDEILIGKHTLVYRDEGGVPLAATAATEKTQEVKSASEETIVLDTKKRREFLAKATTIASEGASAETKDKVGCLTVLAGKTDQREYILTSKLCVIGKSEMASVKLKGWFAPKVAAVINRREGRYEIAPSEKAGATKVNSQVLAAPHALQEGDTIQIGGVQMQFYFRE
ncbi:MAG: FHA domain-containing protein [Acidobacteria bacterium]|nr:FHA domain-containing protein [Acidobacteriota bacterium]